MVVEDGGVGGIELESAIELDKCFVVHAVAAKSYAGHHVNVPVIRSSGEKVGDAVAGRLLLTTREQHVFAVEVRFDCCWIESKSFVEVTASAHDMDLPAEAVAHILQFGDA